MTTTTSRHSLFSPLVAIQTVVRLRSWSIFINFPPFFSIGGASVAGFERCVFKVLLYTFPCYFNSCHSVFLYAISGYWWGRSSLIYNLNQSTILNGNLKFLRSPLFVVTYFWNISFSEVLNWCVEIFRLFQNSPSKTWSWVSNFSS